jgi:hypothetical protein
MFGRFIVRRIFTGRYVPLGGRRTSLGTYTRNLNEFDRRFYSAMHGKSTKSSGDIIYELADDAYDAGEIWANHQAEEKYWNDFIEEFFSSLEEIPDLNPGQKSIIQSFTDGALSWVKRSYQDYNPDSFISYAKEDLGDEKYNAVSQTIESAAVTLEEARASIFGYSDMAAFVGSLHLNSLSAYSASKITSAARMARSQIENYRRRIWTLELSKEFLQSARPGFNFGPLAAFDTSRVFTGYKGAVTNWTFGAINRYAAATGRSFYEASQHVYNPLNVNSRNSSKEYERWKFNETVSKLSPTARAYVTGKMSPTETSKMRKQIAQTRSKVQYFGKNW